VKKVSLCDDNSAEKLKKQLDFYTKELKSDLCFSLISR
jgi:hypothetical protein